MSHAVARKESEIIDEIGIDVDPQLASPQPEHVDPKTPSWFSRDVSGEVGDALADRYRATQKSIFPVFETPGPEAHDDYKRRLEERFSQAQRLYDPSEKPIIPERHPTLPLSDIHGRRRLYEQEQREHIVQSVSSKKANASWGRIAGLACVAVVIGGGVGYGAANFDRLNALFNSSVSSAQVTFAGLTSNPPNPKPALNQTTIQKKTIAMASLDVNDARGTLNSMIPLMLSAQAADSANPLAVKITGLPQDAYLTAGTETSKGSWLLKPSDISGVKLVVPQSSSSHLNMEVAAIEEKTGALAAPIKAMNVEISDAKPMASIAPIATQTGDGKSELLAAGNVAATIAPANALPETAMVTASAIPAALPQATELISKADSLLNSGDIASARQFYLQASELGDAKGAFGVGRTYDPQVFAALNVQGLKPDPAKAAEWYKKAMTGGVGAAKNALAGLQL